MITPPASGAESNQPPLTRETACLGVALADRYSIERELGAGGMATVYLAEDVRHHRRVAIKLLHPELSAVLGSERFLKEIELTASLQHPHILPLFDSGSAEGLLYYVMPYVEGETLRARLTRETQLPVRDAVRIATEVADALAYAHGRGVVHRDIKPENILLRNGHALVADFGIALAVQQAGGERMTQTGLSLGTPQYMSPEQAMGERAIDARTDIYALGAVTYEMLAGEPPFTGPNAQAIVAQVLTAEPKRLSSMRATVPAPVDAAVATALQKLPADRFATATEFAGALAAPGASPVESGPAGTPRPASHPRRAMALLVPLVLAAGVAAGSITLHRFAARTRLLSVVAPLAVLLSTAACAACAAGPASLEGTWTLVSVTTRWPDGRTTAPWGTAPVGRLTYGADGRMAALLMDARRNQADGRTAPPEIMASVAGYYGAYAVDPVRHVVTHYVVASIRASEAGAIERHYVLRDDTLVMTAKATYEGALVTHTLVWRRATGSGR